MENQEKRSGAGFGGPAGAVITIAVLVVLGWAGYAYFGSSDKMASEQESATPSVQPTQTVQPSVSSDATESVAPAGEVKVFTVKGGGFYFDPKEIRVNKGDRVRIVFQNVEGFHDWVLDEFNARTPQIQAGQTAQIEFVADKAGTFEYYCSVGKHRAMGMKGNLIVQ